MTTTQRATIAIAAIVLILAPQLNRAELAAEPGKRMRFTGRWVESTLHDLNPDFESRWTRSGGKVGVLSS